MNALLLQMFSKLSFTIDFKKSYKFGMLRKVLIFGPFKGKVFSFLICWND